MLEARMKRKIYEPVRELERQTSYCPLYLAWCILDEARNYFRIPIPETYANKLAHRAEAVLAHNPDMQRLFKSASRRAAILMFMRHWLAGILARVCSAGYRKASKSAGHCLKHTVAADMSPLHLIRADSHRLLRF
jgi:hypothetical protein